MIGNRCWYCSYTAKMVSELSGCKSYSVNADFFLQLGPHRTVTSRSTISSNRGHGRRKASIISSPEICYSVFETFLAWLINASSRSLHGTLGLLRVTTSTTDILSRVDGSNSNASMGLSAATTAQSRITANSKNTTDCCARRQRLSVPHSNLLLDMRNGSRLQDSTVW